MQVHAGASAGDCASEKTPHFDSGGFSQWFGKEIR
jgi:hypothetical protein